MERDSCELLCLDLPMAEAARGRLPAPDDLELLAAGARALGDATRLSVALALREAGSACVCDLGWIVGRDEKLVSHHARVLKASGLTRSRRDGRMVMDELTDRGRALVDAVAGDRERA
jgi:ArsR family transcriptional regulator, lead/cadmium/zinc/bismuth-responsive transcriptional repressor